MAKNVPKIESVASNNGEAAAMTQDEEHLRLLSIFHYVVGGFAGLSALMPAIYLILGLVFVFAPGRLGGNAAPPEPLLGWIFVILGSGFFILGLIFASLIVCAGRFLARKNHRVFCLVVAGVECVFIPFGTALGIFTIIVLTRESVRHLFEPDNLSKASLENPPAIRNQ
jgi:hypothetical protein